MAVTLTADALIAALRLGSTTEERDEVDRLVLYVTEAVSQYLGAAYATTPDVVANEAAIRLAGYIFDAPTASRSTIYANALKNSGAGPMLLPYRIHRGGLSDSEGMAAAAVVTPDAVIEEEADADLVEGLRLALTEALRLVEDRVAALEAAPAPAGGAPTYTLLATGAVTSNNRATFAANAAAATPIIAAWNGGTNYAFLIEMLWGAGGLDFFQTAITIPIRRAHAVGVNQSLHANVAYNDHESQASLEPEAGFLLITDTVVRFDTSADGIPGGATVKLYGVS